MNGSQFSLSDSELNQVVVDLETEGLRSPRVIARGGTSIIISAFDSALAATVAVKVLFREPTAALAEARLLASVPSHVGIVEIHRMGLLSGGWPYLVLELCPSGSLAGYLRDRGPLSPGLAIAVVRELAKAVQQLHELENPVLHLDIKPANLLITRWGGIKLSDFGISNVRGGPLTAAFSPAHAAPEQIAGEALGPYTDLYSMASLLYELISGFAPFGDGSPNEIAASKLRSGNPSLDSPRIPDELRHFLTVYLDRDPQNRRPGDARGFENGLSGVARRLQVDAVPPRLTVLGDWDIPDDLTVELGASTPLVQPRAGVQPTWSTPEAPVGREVPTSSPNSPIENPVADSRPRADGPARADGSSAGRPEPDHIGPRGRSTSLPVIGLDPETSSMVRGRRWPRVSGRAALGVGAAIAVLGIGALAATRLGASDQDERLLRALATPIVDPLLVSGDEPAPNLTLVRPDRLSVEADHSGGEWIVQVSEWEIDPRSKLPGDQPVSVRALPKVGDEPTADPGEALVSDTPSISVELNVRPEVLTCFAVQSLSGSEPEPPGAPSCTPTERPAERTLGTEVDEPANDAKPNRFSGSLTIGSGAQEPSSEATAPEVVVQRDLLLEWDGDELAAVQDIEDTRVQVSGPKDRCWSVVSGNAVAPLPALAVGEVPDLSSAVRSPRLCPWLGG